MPKTKARAKARTAKRNGRPRGRPPGSTHQPELDPQEFLKELPHLSKVEWVEVECPYCGESFDTPADPSFESSDRLENCQLCCRTMQVHTEAEDGAVSVYTSRT